MRVTPTFIDPGAGPNVSDERFLPREWLRRMRPPVVTTRTSAAAQPIRVTVLLLLHVRLGDLGVQVWFGVVPNLVTHVLLGTIFIKKLNKEIFPIKQRIFLIKSRAIPILDTSSADHRYFSSALQRPTRLGTKAVVFSKVSRPLIPRVRYVSPCGYRMKGMVYCPLPGLVTTYPRQSTIRKRQYLTSHGLMDNFSVTSLHVLVLNQSETERSSQST